MSALNEFLGYGKDNNLKIEKGYKLALREKVNLLVFIKKSKRNLSNYKNEAVLILETQIKELELKLFLCQKAIQILDKKYNPVVIELMEKLQSWMGGLVMPAINPSETDKIFFGVSPDSPKIVLVTLTRADNKKVTYKYKANDAKFTEWFHKNYSK